MNQSTNDDQVDMSVQEAIAAAEALLSGEPAPDGENDPRWEAMIGVGDYVETHAEEVWVFVARWGTHDQRDLRMAIACSVLEHLLEYHFELVFSRVERLARDKQHFADTFCSCWEFGRTKLPENSARFDRLKDELRNRSVQNLPGGA